jgi:hypothetical protein
VAENEANEYEIRVSGHLASRWAEWFDGMTLTAGPDGTSVISGMVPDQSALHGLLRKLGDLGVPLVSVTRAYPDDTDTPTATTPIDPTRRSTT